MLPGWEIGVETNIVSSNDLELVPALSISALHDKVSQYLQAEDHTQKHSNVPQNFFRIQFVV